ncbi:hypothetical protein GGI35DRAFT_469238 [Trichoderma velutinum]
MFGHFFLLSTSLAALSFESAYGAAFIPQNPVARSRPSFSAQLSKRAGIQAPNDEFIPLSINYPVTEDGRCGIDFGTRCENDECCSTEGWCGTGYYYCSAPACQFDYGPRCDANRRPDGPDTEDWPRDHVGSVPYGEGIFHCSKPGTVALTFDDGPWEYTEELLDILEERGVRATFFITGRNLGKGAINDPSTDWPRLIHRMKAEGHQIGSHTWSHQCLPLIDKSHVRQQMLYNEIAIADILGVFPTYMRPPYSASDEDVDELLGELGYHVTYFNLDTEGYLHEDAIEISQDIAEKAFEGKDPETDSYLQIEHDTVSESVHTLVPYLIDLLFNAGFKPVTVGECLEDPEENWYRSRDGGIEKRVVKTDQDPISVEDANQAVHVSNASMHATKKIQPSQDSRFKVKNPLPFLNKFRFTSPRHYHQFTRDNTPDFPTNGSHPAVNETLPFTNLVPTADGRCGRAFSNTTYAEKVEATCQFCSLLLREARHLTRSGRVIRQVDGRPLIFSFERECQTGVAEHGITEFTRTIILKVDLQPVPTPEDSEIKFNICPIFTDRGDDHLQCAQFVSADSIDLGLCSKWLRDCETSHLPYCRDLGQEMDKSPLPQGFRLVDTIDKCIIPAPQDCRYIALSYVWGRAATLKLIEDNTEIFERPGSLVEHMADLPRTVQDAMHVVRSMGERYLWVDRLCIIQDSPQKGEQVAKMDSIYGAAVLTIVAAYGSDANAGLRGVRAGSRIFNQSAATIWHDLTLVAAAPSPGDITESIWATRGWTYQEQLLSQRLLVFTTEGQAVWQCASSHLLEDTSSIIKARPVKRLRQMRDGLRSNERQPAPNPTLSPMPLQQPDAITEYGAVVQGYTKRRFTFEDDVLAAFQGFGSILQRQLNSGFLAGLPEAYLDQALLWIPSSRQKRRKGNEKHLPSWSWAGWNGHAHYEELDSSNTERIVPVLKWYYTENDQIARPINHIGIGIDESRFGKGRSSNTFFWVPIFELLADSLNIRPTSNLDSQQRLLLQFWTSCSQFHIAPRQSDRLIAGQRESSMDRPIKLHLFLGQSERQLSGYLILNGESLVELDQTRHEFIVLSEAQFSGFNPITSACTPSEQSMMYNVMLIEWDDDREMASRLGIGRVLKQAWDASNPVIKFIALG